MNKVKELLVKYRVKVCIGTLIGLVIIGIYFLMMPDKIKVVLNDNAKKGIVIEYGNSIDQNIETYIDFKGLDEKEKQEILETTKIKTNSTNEKEKEYPAVGTYEVELLYKDQKVIAKVEVKDTVAPELTTLQYVECILGTEFDFSKYTKATDLATIEVTYDTSAYNKDIAGEYVVKAIVKDASNNSTEKQITVKIFDTPTENQEVKVIEDLENGKIALQITDKPVVQKPQSPVQNTAPASTAKEPVIELNTPYINQYANGAPMGCEGASLLQALQAKGYASGIGLKTILDAMPYTSDGNPYNGFVSSPYIIDDAMVYQSIFPSALTPFGNNYGTCINTSGSSAAQLVEQLKAGNPSVVYVTYKFAYPKWDTYSFGRCTSNMHVMTLIGYNGNTGQYKVMDPAGEGAYWVNKKSFENAYNALRFAITVK